MAISIAPSQYWEGNDGPWSTFAVQVGTPSTAIRVLPATSKDSIWAVLPEACQIEGAPSNCGDLRGVAFNINSSSTFERVGGGDRYFQLDFVAEQDLDGYSGNSAVGLDTATLGWEGSHAPTLNSQVIVGYAVEQPFLGVLGLTARPVNTTSFLDRHASPLGALGNNGTVDSSYFGYSAGARYRTPQAYGSLTFGGYDAVRGNVDNVLTVPFGVNTDRDLLVAINSINLKSKSTVVSDGLPIYSYIDSMVPEIWLPVSACQSFEKAFGLSWNDTLGAYPVNDTLHTALVAQNASVSFSLGATTGASNGTIITLPYASFDLTASYPKFELQANSSMRYFPLIRAQNASQYTLGRTFLQEAYLAVDYDRSQFHISPATFASDATSTKVVAIPAPGARSSNLSGGAMASIMIAILAVLAIGFGFGWWYWKRNRKTKQRQRYESVMNAADEEMRQQHEREQSKFKPELDAFGTAVAKPCPERQELHGGRDSRYLDDTKDAKGASDPAELGGQEMAEAPNTPDPVELEEKSKKHHVNTFELP